MAQQDHELHVVTHLEEMRKRLIVTLCSFLVALAAAFLYAKPIYAWLVRDMEGRLTVLGPTDMLWVYLMISGVFAIAVTIPVAGIQLWSFLKPALKPDERKAALAFIPALAVLFAAGISFGYFVLFPMVLSFMKAMAQEQVNIMYTADKYFRFMLNLTLPLGLLFEMPAVVMFLTKIGVLNPVRLAKARKVAYFVLIVVSITITPPDFVSDVLVIVPLLLLYEFSITLSKWVYKKKLTVVSEA
ncbi:MULTISPECIES: twin-arginine translocase subunit TatC [unclassified Paenibacillus]|uniref:twin-arginine translocase subunit TatC n=1 Tax=unclassified Paenibacillus TaxID=185978 RepID=UPI001AE97330|nr:MULTISPECIES: twin-arginine translocase subunit TatC [unclassified Paenibacillus]MBP1155448.1 sec-independent protein translocase protein TatC [Paenibacillus sp. PvP091]MBP1169167.1 sec-independent protein translocase protein TatC [Paenibacillus sp. PvR098]MBP2440195.1 sec-independent protein translocase protein TatC [Paenibacillus sp. PvP052]